MRHKSTEPYKKKFPPIVYGLEGICQLFNVSLSVAYKYKKDVISKACIQRDRVILVDTAKALSLYGMKDSAGFVSKDKLPPVVYGLGGIQHIFHISMTTAWKYRYGFLQSACTQKEKKIMVDTAKALKLFGFSNPEKFIVSES